MKIINIKMKGVIIGRVSPLISLNHLQLARNSSFEKRLRSYFRYPPNIPFLIGHPLYFLPYNSFPLIPDSIHFQHTSDILVYLITSLELQINFLRVLLLTVPLSQILFHRDCMLKYSYLQLLSRYSKI